MHKRRWPTFVACRQSLDVTLLYNEFNAPFRPITRVCATCNHSIQCAQPPLMEFSERKLLLDKVAGQLQDLNSLISDPDDSKKAQKLISNFDQESLALHKGCLEPTRLYKSLIPPLSQLKNTNTHLLSLVSVELIRLECSPEAWQDLQFLHLQHFSQVDCPHCSHSVCFSCGETAHPSISCTQHMSAMVLQVGLKSPLLKTLDWKLKNSKACPRCCILITRDDGCNKMECSYCGFGFCWSVFIF